MKSSFFNTIDNFWQINVISYIKLLQQNPIRIMLLILDLAIVIFLAYNLIKAAKKLRVWQLIKGIALLVVITLVSRLDTFRHITLYISFYYDIWGYCYASYIST